MIYNLINDTSKIQAQTYFNFLCTKGVKCEIKEVREKRSISQNSYLHLILSKFGLHFGYTLEESKTIYKEINKNIFVYSKKNRNFVKSSAELNTKEMTDSIEKFRNKSAENGCYLPSPDERLFLDEIKNEIETNKQYL